LPISENCFSLTEGPNRSVHLRIKKASKTAAPHCARRRFIKP
jgi:hypothetical protein